MSTYFAGLITGIVLTVLVWIWRWWKQKDNRERINELEDNIKILKIKNEGFKHEKIPDDIQSAFGDLQGANKFK